MPHKLATIERAVLKVVNELTRCKGNRTYVESGTKVHLNYGVPKSLIIADLHERTEVPVGIERIEDAIEELRVDRLLVTTEFSPSQASALAKVTYKRPDGRIVRGGMDGNPEILYATLDKKPVDGEHLDDPLLGVARGSLFLQDQGQGPGRSERESDVRSGGEDGGCRQSWQRVSGTDSRWRSILGKQGVSSSEGSPRLDDKENRGNCWRFETDITSL